MTATNNGSKGRREGAAGNVPACAICGKPRTEEYRPFCSKRCADVDLGRWLKGTYVIPGHADADEDGEGAGDRIDDPSSDGSGRA